MQPVIRVLVAVMAWTWVLSPTTAPASAVRVDQLIQDALSLEPDARRGATVYRQQCERCHGGSAAGDADNVVPALAGQRESYLVKQFADFTEFERGAREMHSVLAKAVLSEPQVWANLARYLGSLPPAKTTETGNGGGVRLGARLFAEQCASCHMDDAGGDEEGFVPSLRSQHYSYLLQQMRSLAASHRQNVDDDVAALLDGLQTEDLTALADYLSQQRGPARDRARLRDDGILRN